MFLKHLELKNFRNYININLDLKCGLILFLGENGTGKTNLLESVFYLANGKSHRLTTQNDLINHNSDYCIIRGLIESGGEDKLIEIQLNSDGSLKIKFNKAFVKNKSIFTSSLATVIFSPDDLRIIKSSPFYRRNFIDDIIEKTDSNFLKLRLRYQKILNQRNSLLKSISGFNISNSNNTIEIWNEKLIETGSLIIKKRLALIKLIKPVFIKYMNYFFNKRNFDIKYMFSWERLQSSDESFFNGNFEKDPNMQSSYFLKQKNYEYDNGDNEYIGDTSVKNELESNHGETIKNFDKSEDSNDLYINNKKLNNKNNLENLNNNPGNFSMQFDEVEVDKVFEEKLDYYFKKDVSVKTTTIGPHRDDLVIFLDGCDIRNFGSQGQQRIAAICLKLAEFDLLAESINEKPMLLLDDVLSELDLERKHLLLKLIGNNFQTFITAANFDYLKDIDLKYCEKYLVKDSKIIVCQD
ncbi:MAG: DNA replication and repair protein RecF [Cyanobacteria bacterium]|nr:DNA replication and repair protein RecF [Cyanobacteriota bacterium]